MPNKSPYYSLNLFKVIKAAEEEGLDATNMKIEEWYNFLTEKFVTHQKIETRYELKLTKKELSNPHIHHLNSYQNIRKLGHQK